MRIKRINVIEWRNFREIDISVPDGANLVCFVGANGTGKSNLLELISASAHHFGLSPGIHIPRGSPFEGQHHFTMEIGISVAAIPAVIAEVRAHGTFGPLLASWDHSMKIDAKTGQQPILTAGGVDHPGFASHVADRLRGSKELHYLYLDSDRSYPRRDIPIHELGQIYQTDWSEPGHLKGRSFVATGMLYDEWLKTMLSREANNALNYAKDVRQARESGNADPIFIDPFLEYKQSLAKILPHLKFVGAKTDERTILFDSAGKTLRFDQLSGGERELAFLVGQIDRFKLKRGLFVIDEPELHLNPDLLRTWIEYLNKVIEDGQNSFVIRPTPEQACGFITVWPQRRGGTGRVFPLLPLKASPLDLIGSRLLLIRQLHLMRCALRREHHIISFPNYRSICKRRHNGIIKLERMQTYGRNVRESKFLMPFTTA